MAICCGNSIDGLYSATIVSEDTGERYKWEVESPTLDPTIYAHEERSGSRAISTTRKRSTMSMTLTIVDDIDDNLQGNGAVIYRNSIFKPILGQCGLTITLVSECGSNVFTMTNATEVSGSAINLSEGTVDVTFSSPNVVQCDGINTEAIREIFPNFGVI